MEFGDDLRGELFNKLGVDKDADPLELIEKGNTEKKAGNRAKAKNLYEQANKIAATRAQKYTQQNQHRAAAESLYLQALAQEKLEEKTESDKLYFLVIDQLLSAADSAMKFGEDKRGITEAVLAGMVALLVEDEDKAFGIYNDYTEKAEGRQDNEYLKKLLYSLGYLLDALQNENVGAITDAQNYISADLRPMLSTAKLKTFENLLDNIINHTRKQLESKIQMPKIHISTSVPKDIQFNQIFSMDLDISNNGDGVASNVELVTEIPKDIEILDGKKIERMEEFAPGTSLQRKFRLRFQTGEANETEIREIRGHIAFTDMLGNDHKQYFGPFEIEFSATSRKSDFQKELRDLLSSVETLSSEDVYKLTPPTFFETLHDLNQSISDKISEKIEAEEFERVEFGLSLFEETINLTKQLTEENEVTMKINEYINNKISKEVESIKSTLKTRYEIEKEEAIENLTEEMTEKRRQKLIEQREELKTEYDQELEELRDEHRKELQQIQTSHESKLKQQLAQLENKLKAEFQEELNKKNEEIEKVVREYQEKERSLVQEAKEEAKNELTAKYEKKIKEMEDNMEEMKRQMTARHEEEKKLELKTLRQQLEREKQEALEQQERELREEFNQTGG